MRLILWDVKWTFIKNKIEWKNGNKRVKQQRNLNILTQFLNMLKNLHKFINNSNFTWLILISFTGTLRQVNFHKWSQHQINRKAAYHKNSESWQHRLDCWRNHDRHPSSRSSKRKAHNHLHKNCPSAWRLASLRRYKLFECSTILTYLSYLLTYSLHPLDFYLF